MAAASQPKVPKSLAEMGTFFVSLWPKGAGFPPLKKPIPLHDWVIRPIVNAASECRIYGLDYDRKFLKWIDPIVKKSGGSWQLNLDGEVITGYEPLWNDCCKTSGIAFVTQLLDEHLSEIFRHTSKPGIWASRYTLTEGSSKAAVNFCSKPPGSGKTSPSCFPAATALNGWTFLCIPNA